MGISENDQLVLGCLTAFLDIEILADRLAKYRVPQIFLTVKNIAYGRIVPCLLYTSMVWPSPMSL